MHTQTSLFDRIARRLWLGVFLVYTAAALVLIGAAVNGIAF